MQTVSKLIGFPRAGGATGRFGSKSKGISIQPLQGARGGGAGDGVFYVAANGKAWRAQVWAATPSVIFTRAGNGALLSAGGLFGEDGGGGGGVSPGKGASTLRKVTIGKRGGVKVRVIGKRKGNRGKVTNEARPVGSALYGAADMGEDESAFFGPFLEDCLAANFDCPLFEDKRKFMLYVFGAAAVPDDIAGRLQAVGWAAAWRQARKIRNMRGVSPSFTSIEDAASDAVVSILSSAGKGRFVVRGVGYDGAAGIDRLRAVSAKRWAGKRFLVLLATWAGKGAFASFASWASVGMAGDSGRKLGVVESLTTEICESMAAADVSQYEYEGTRAARLSAVRWVYRVGFVQFVAALPVGMRGTARAAAVRGARARCRVVGAVLLGSDYISACKAGALGRVDSGRQYVAALAAAKAGKAGPSGGDILGGVVAGGFLQGESNTGQGGFGSVESFSHSCDKAGFWQALQVASAKRPNFAAEWWAGQAQAWAIDARAAIKAGRACGSLPEFNGERVTFSPARARRDAGRLVQWRAMFGGQAGQAIAGRQAGQAARAAAAAKLIEWRGLVADRAAAVAEVHACRKAWRAVRAADKAAFDRVRSGLTSDKFKGSLRRVTVPKIKGQAGKMDGNKVLRPSGKVQRAAADWCVVLAVGKAGRELPCARSVGGCRVIGAGWGADAVAAV